MAFRIVSPISNIDTIAVGPALRERKRLAKAYGRGAWRKRKGTAQVRLPDGTTLRAELHWYEAHGVGQREFKIKRYLAWPP